MRAILILAATLLVATAVGAVLIVTSTMSRFDQVRDEAALKGIPSASRSGLFDVLWQVEINPPLTVSITAPPASWPGDLAAVSANDKIRLLTRDGAVLQTINGPDNTVSIQGDAAMPFMLVVSRDYRWSGIDRLVRTSHVHALDASGRSLWTRDFPAEPHQRVPRPALATLNGTRVILLEYGDELVCLDLKGETLWQRPYPRAARKIRFTGPISGQEPEYVATFPAGRGRLGIDHPSRKFEIPLSFSSYDLLGVTATEVALSRHFLRAGGGTGTAITIVRVSDGFAYEAPAGADAGVLAVEPLDTDGDGAAIWLGVSTDGALRLIVPGALGDIVEHTGVRVQRVMLLPGSPPIVVMGTHKGLAAWRPSTALVGRYE